MSWTHLRQSHFTDELLSLRRGLVAYYRGLMGLVMVAILAASAWVYVRRPFGDGSQGEYFYFGAAALLLFGCAASHMIWAGRPRSRLLRQFPSVSVSTDAAGNGRAWRLQIEPPSDEIVTAGAGQFDVSQNLSIPFASLGVEMLPDDESLACIESELARGSNLESACRLVQPAYEKWELLQRRAYQMHVMSMLTAPRRRDLDDA